MYANGSACLLWLLCEYSSIGWLSTVTVVAVSGSSFSLTGSVGGNYKIATPLAGISAVLSAHYLYRTSLQDRILTSSTPLVIDTSTSGTQRVLNAVLGLEAARWSVQLFADNALDARESIYPSFDNFNVYQRPRTIGMQASFSYR